MIFATFLCRSPLTTQAPMRFSLSGSIILCLVPPLPVNTMHYILTLQEVVRLLVESLAIAPFIESHLLKATEKPLSIQAASVENPMVTISLFASSIGRANAVFFLLIIYR